MKDTKQAISSQTQQVQAGPDGGSELSQEQLDQAAGGMFNSIANFAGNAARDVANAVGTAVKNSGKGGGK